MTTAVPPHHEDIKTRRIEPLANDIVTEDSAAMEFVDEHCGDLRYCHTTGAWFRWNGVFWKRDDTGCAFQWARELARKLAEDQDKRGRYLTSKVSFANAVERFAQVDPKVAVTASYWDRDPWKLGTPGGTVDLQTGILHEPRQDEGITKATSVAPLDQDCPLWKRFLNEATRGDVDLIRFLRQWCGYCLTGITREHALAFVHGSGGNGKSVFINIVTSIMNDYATTAAMETFSAGKYAQHPTDLAMLRGARIVTASETEEGRAWAEARIKQMTGGDPITARFMRQDFFTFKPQFKLTIIGNHQPVLHSVDDAARRRFNIIPVIHSPETPDRDLERKLMIEAPAILQWMIEGCLDWQRNGLCRPESVNAATAAYFSDQDLMGQWLEDCCEVKKDRGPNGIWDRSSDLFESWAEYAHKAGDEPGSKKSFGQSMQRRGFEPYRIPNVGTRAFRFVRLRTMVKGSDA
ncbi:hypothetical protein NB311A_17619 [Nitrobacter sp. Nb-311A]|uniref:phage/plasmid primase, P4 family n=1 Tax=Nitrobacter sp. Nb-311A TaxID=314253 RepID=UPI000068738D|nr:phage/plasmid primase, P4 family [Nitrobacter sp. Nb-311A]EAQ35618.1 hypothetical protein NB311A_17619 [Nitrobacter sp. Nb-311A]